MTIKVVNPFRSQHVKIFDKSKIGRNPHVDERIPAADVSLCLGQKVFQFGTAIIGVDDNPSRLGTLEHMKAVQPSSPVNVDTDIDTGKQKKLLSKVKSTKKSIIKLFKLANRVSEDVPGIDPFATPSINNECSAKKDNHSSLPHLSMRQDAEPRVPVPATYESIPSPCISSGTPLRIALSEKAVEDHIKGSASPYHGSVETSSPSSTGQLSLTPKLQLDTQAAVKVLDTELASAFCGSIEASSPSSTGRLFRMPELQLGIPSPTFLFDESHTIDEGDGGIQAVVKVLHAKLASTCRGPAEASSPSLIGRLFRTPERRHCIPPSTSSVNVLRTITDQDGVVVGMLDTELTSTSGYCDSVEASSPSSTGQLFLTPKLQLDIPSSAFSFDELHTINEEDGYTRLAVGVLDVEPASVQASTPSSTGQLFRMPDPQLDMLSPTFLFDELHTTDEEGGGARVIVKVAYAEQKELKVHGADVSRSSRDTEATAYLSSDTPSTYTMAHGASPKTSTSPVDTSFATSVDAEEGHPFLSGAHRGLRRVPRYEDLKTVANHDLSCSDTSRASDGDFSWEAALVTDVLLPRRSMQFDDPRKSSSSLLECKTSAPSTRPMNRYKKLRTWLSPRCHESSRDKQRMSASRAPSKNQKVAPMSGSHQLLQSVFRPSAHVRAHVLKPSSHLPPASSPPPIPIWSCAKIMRSSSNVKKRRKMTKQAMKELKARLDSMDIDPWE